MSDLFTGFTLFNRRISSILQAIPLHIVISREHCRRQIDFLSSHLTFHEHQVISINISDIIRDDSYIIRLLFNRHNFPNLKSCKLLSIDSMTKFGDIIKQIENLSNYRCIPSNLTSLNIRIAGSPSNVSIHSVIRVFRLCHQIKYLCIVLYNEKRFKNDNTKYISNYLSSVIENDLLILSQLTYFELLIGSFQLLVQKSSWSFTNEYLNGYVWQQMFELYLQYLSKFEFHMTVTKRIPKLDLDFVIKSFNYFVQKYSNWDMIIDRWIYGRRLREHLKLYIENEKCNITWSSSLFQNVTYLLVEGPIIKSSWLNYLYNIVNFRQTIDEENNAQEYVTYISHFVNLENVTKLEFRSTYSIEKYF
ncbi:unnamed protein product [Rotaria sordida]|uniref:Uncharacterized protein n=1 Tax=Rotaria sordida TaxID=392033 RepID=A0A819UQL8_9BILA|nr:unnamed protein product [Rotaria sordida]CAF4099798.1 unnamed protein product [Rotaria sordida]